MLKNVPALQATSELKPPKIHEFTIKRIELALTREKCYFFLEPRLGMG